MRKKKKTLQNGVTNRKTFLVRTYSGQTSFKNLNKMGWGKKWDVKKERFSPYGHISAK